MWDLNEYCTATSDEKESQRKEEVTAVDEVTALAKVIRTSYVGAIVVWVICYALMSLEMLAVDIENPFDGTGKSDLKLIEQFNFIRESAPESWNRWCDCEWDRKVQVTSNSPPFVDDAVVDEGY